MKMQKKVSRIFFQNKYILLLIVLGSLSWSLVMIRSGLRYDYGLGFWGPNGHDGIWHIALINSLTRFPWQMPTYAGVPLKNYHIGFDLLIAAVHKLTAVPVHNLYFQVIPPILAILMGLLTYKFVSLWKKSQKSAFWGTFFVYFGGSFGWIITLFYRKTLGGESMFWSQQAISTLINPPFALSLVVLLTGLIFLQKKHAPFAILAFGVLIQIKSYAGALALGSLLVAGVYQMLFQKKAETLKIFTGSLVLSLILYLPLNANSSSLLVFKPFWFLETMMQLTDRVGWIKFGEAMVNYKYANNFFKAIPAYAVAFAIFIIGNLGTRIISLKYFFKKLDMDILNVYIFSLIAAGIIIPTFFVQKGTPWNTIQFFYYSLFFLSILAGVTLASILQNTHTILIHIIIVITVVLTTIPTTIGTLKDIYLPTAPPSYLSTAELEALNFLSQEPQGVVLTYPFDEKASKSAKAPKPLYLYVSTSYVSAFSKKPVFLEDEMNADITGLNWRKRREEIEKFYSSLDHKFVYNFLRDKNISYIYWVKPQRAPLGETQLGIDRIFENEEVDIYKVAN